MAWHRLKGEQTKQRKRIPSLRELLHFCKKSFRQKSAFAQNSAYATLLYRRHPRTHASTRRYTRVFRDSLTRAEDAVDSGVIKELIVLRRNNTTTHHDDITENKATTKAVNTDLADISLFLDSDWPFLCHVTYRDYKVTRIDVSF